MSVEQRRRAVDGCIAKFAEREGVSRAEAGLRFDRELAGVESREQLFDLLARFSVGAPVQLDLDRARPSAPGFDIFTCTHLPPCRRCGRQKAMYMEKQTRSADEPATLFVTCACGNKWKQ